VPLTHSEMDDVAAYINTLAKYDEAQRSSNSLRQCVAARPPMDPYASVREEPGYCAGADIPFFRKIGSFSHQYAEDSFESRYCRRAGGRIPTPDWRAPYLGSNR
jgi:hypothetical protein